MNVASVPHTKIPVSVIVMTKDEEQNIAKCLRSVRDFAEVFVVDSGSADRTCALAEGMGGKVIAFRWNGKYPKKKQWCIVNLTFAHDWVFIVDAEEDVSQQLCTDLWYDIEST